MKAKKPLRELNNAYEQMILESAKRMTTKHDRIATLLKLSAGMNRYEAENYGDHCLHSTVSRLRERGFAINDRWEYVPTRFGQTRVKRYWRT